MSNSVFQILGISSQDMLARLMDLNVTSNNLANVNTPGYKQSRANFQELLQSKQLEGTQLLSTQILTQQGNVVQTGNPLDLAIDGEGFFGVRLPDGRTGYTRDGQFSMNANGAIVNGNGLPLVWQGQLPANTEEVSVQANGTVSARVGTTWSQAGTIQLTRFPNQTGLEIRGDNLLLPSAASGAAQNGAPGSTNFGKIVPQAVEQSNVDLTSEMTHLMALERSFQISTKVFQQTDTMISEAIMMRS